MIQQELLRSYKIWNDSLKEVIFNVKNKNQSWALL